MAWEDVIPRSGRIVGEGCEVTVAWRRTGTDTSPRLVVNLAVPLCKRLGLLSKDRIRLQRDLKAGKLRLSKIDDKAPPAMKKLGFSLNLKDGTGYVVFRLDGVESAPQRAKHVPYEVSDEERAVVLTLPDWGAPERVAFERKSAAVKQAVALAKGADLSPQDRAEREDIIEARMMIERGDTAAGEAGMWRSMAATVRSLHRDRQTAEARSAAGVEWQPIETAPKTDANRVVYILIGDGVCLPDIVTWRPRRPARTDEYGTFRHAVPEGWFLCGGGRSRLDGRATCWASVPNYLPTPPAGGADDAE